MLEQARKKTVDLLNIELLEGDATCLPLPSESYDAVMCTQACEGVMCSDEGCVREHVRVYNCISGMLLLLYLFSFYCSIIR